MATGATGRDIESNRAQACCETCHLRSSSYVRSGMGESIIGIVDGLWKITMFMIINRHNLFDFQ